MDRIAAMRVVCKSKDEYTDDCQTKYIALKKCLFLTLYLRNFLAAQEYVNLLSQYDKQLDDLWKEMQELLQLIKETVDRKTSKDIVCYWLDALPYEDEKDMLYLQTVLKDSIVFENAFTYIDNTHPTLRAMFLGKRDIE